MINLRSAIDFALPLCTPGSPQHVKETDGHNRSAEIDAMNRLCGAKLGSPYCASGVSAVFAMAAAERGTGKRFRPSASSQAILRTFQASGEWSSEAADLLNWQGALGGWTGENGHGHIFLITGRLTTTGGKVVAIKTAEFNTSPSTGSRDGEGAYCLEREVPVDRGHRLWFLDTSAYSGGRWWPKVG